MNSEYLSIEEIRCGIEAKAFSAEEVVRRYLDKIKGKDNKINAFTSLCENEALEQAIDIDKKIKSGKPLGRLAGIPVAIKDNICTKGIATSCSSKMLKDFVPPYDATVIRKLKAEDAIIIGKTNMDEFAMGSSTENSAFMVTRNPYDLERVPGGSSGGSAAAVSADMVPLSLGSDTGGSIRQPAAFCGVVGMKPTYGSVSRYGLVAFGSSLDQIGPFSKTVRESALMTELIQGEDPMDSTSVKNRKYEDYLLELEAGVRGLKVGIPKEFFQTGLDVEIKTSIENSIKRLEALGASIEEVSLPLTTEGLSAYYIISSAEASSNLARYDGVRYGYRPDEFNDIEELIERSRSEAFGKEVKRRIMLGTYVLSSGYYDAYYNKAQKFRKKLKQQFKDIFNNYDLLISPVSPVMPFKIGERSHNPLEMYLADIYTINVNLAGVPAISLPCGFSKYGLPIGLQIIGPHFGEKTIFQGAYALEQDLKLEL
jgi:aspartyl-tRNA(Asn)/glutamyl-tRNA(Gln) amidotransferase subunit A